MIATLASRCHDANQSLLYPVPNDSRTIEMARHVCARCPIRAECLDAALRDPATQGIWGGMTAAERAGQRRRDRHR
jgi:WhiB family transcriptional regulator, redox-sensing transcriptional regulator